MRVVQFTIPVAHEHSIIVQEDILPHFYNHLHRHPEIQMVRILQGTGTLLAGNYMDRFKPGDLFILGSNQPHVFKSDAAYFEPGSRKMIHALSVFFNPTGLFGPILNLPEMSQVKKFVARTAYGMTLTGGDKKAIGDALLSLGRYSNELLVAHFIHFLQTAASSRHWQTLSTISQENTFTDSEGLRMNDIYQYTLAHYQENISLQEIAAVAHLTPQAFCRYFKKHTRQTFLSFLNEVRINEACKKFNSGKFDSVATIAYNSGFNSITNFNRVFKNIMGTSPREYIQAYSSVS